MTAGYAKVAKTILVVSSSLCCWHQTRTILQGGGRCFGRKLDLLVVSQAGCLRPEEVFWFTWVLSFDTCKGETSAESSVQVVCTDKGALSHIIRSNVPEQSKKKYVSL